MSSKTGIQGMRPPDQKCLDFPPNTCILWDKSATAKASFLHLGYYRKPKVYIPEKILKLVQHQCEIYGLKYHTLIGSMIVEDDGEGVQFQVDRLDTRPLVSPDLSANLAPGDLLIPLEVTNNAAKDRIGSEDDFSAALERLQAQCCSKDCIDISNFVLLRAWGSFYSNSTSSVVHMDFDLVTMGTVFKATPIHPVPIALTALSKNLAGPMSLSSTQGMPKSGYLTMDHTRKLLLILESDPKSASLPIVGIWVSGADFVQHPFVWAACLRYIHNTHLQDRVCFPPEEFLLVLYSNLHSRPEFYQCCTASGETKFMYELRTGHEVGNLTKALSSPSGDIFEIEFSLPEHGDKKAVFDAAVDNFSHSVLNIDSESHLEEWTGMHEDITPRSAPTPYTEKIPVFQPMVPDVSILWSDVSHQSDMSTGASHQTQLHHPSPMGLSPFLAPNGSLKAMPHHLRMHTAEDRQQISQTTLIQTKRSHMGARPPHGHSSQGSFVQQLPTPCSVSSSLPRQHRPYSTSPSMPPTPAFHGMMSSPPFTIPHVRSTDTRSFTHPYVTLPQQAFPVVTHSSQSVSCNSENASTHNCSLIQAAQMSTNIVSISTPRNDGLSNSGQKSGPNTHRNPMSRNGIPASHARISTNINNNVSSQCSQNQIVKRDIVIHDSSSQERNYPSCGNVIFTQSPKVASSSNTASSGQSSSVSHNSQMNHAYNHHVPQSQLAFPCSSGQQTKPKTPHQQNHAPSVRHCYVPLNTVIEENLSSTTSSEESCQCHSVRNLQLSRHGENVVDINASNNTQNSTKSSDDDSGLSVTPERQVTSPHPVPNSQPSVGVYPEQAANQAALPASGMESVNWENVPPEIRALIIHQNEQLKQLQQQIQFLMKRESQSSAVPENPSEGQSVSNQVPPSSQRTNICSVAVNTTIIKDIQEDNHSKSVQTSPYKTYPVDASITPSLDGGNCDNVNVKDEHSNKTISDPTDGLPVHTLEINSEAEEEKSPQSQQQMSLPVNEIPIDNRLNLTDSELMDDHPHEFSGPRSESEHSSTERNYFIDGQNDSFSTMAEDASDPRQYYDQLMNNIQLFLLNGENENEDSSAMTDKTTPVSNYGISASGLRMEGSNTTLTPQLNYMSMMLGLGSDAGQSMEINAMAMKYLNDEQLTQIARMRQKGGSDASSNAKILQKVIGDMKLSTPEVSHFGISPNDLTMGTRKYLERHGLLGDNSFESNELSAFDHSMKLKTDFSMAYFSQDAAGNNDNYQYGQSPRLLTNTPIRKEFVQKQNQQTPTTPFTAASESKQNLTGSSKGNGVMKSLGASPVLMAPKHYNVTEATPARYPSKPLSDQRKIQKKIIPNKGVWKGQNAERNAFSNTDEQEEENILDIAKLKQLPKLL